VFTGQDDPESGVRILVAAVGVERVVVPGILAVSIDWSETMGVAQRPLFSGS